MPFRVNQSTVIGDHNVKGPLRLEPAVESRRS